MLTSPQAYLALGPNAGSLRIPTATFGMAYFAALLVWYLFIGPPTYERRKWFLVPALVLIGGILYSVSAIQVMAQVLNRWCAICIAAHALNGGLVLLSLIAWPWRRPRREVLPHPTARLALAVILAGVLLLLVHVLVFCSSGRVITRRIEYTRIVGTRVRPLGLPRQAAADIPLYGRSVRQPRRRTVVVFGDFQCTVCKQSHEMLMEVARNTRAKSASRSATTRHSLQS